MKAVFIVKIKEDNSVVYDTKGDSVHLRAALLSVCKQDKLVFDLVKSVYECSRGMIHK